MRNAHNKTVVDRQSTSAELVRALAIPNWLHINKNIYSLLDTYAWHDAWNDSILATLLDAASRGFTSFKSTGKKKKL